MLHSRLETQCSDFTVLSSSCQFNLLRDVESFGKEMEAYNTRPLLLLLKPYHQAVINLTAETSNLTLLDGTAMTEAELSGCGLPQTLKGVWFAKLLLALYFNDHEVMRVNLNKLLYDRPPDGDGCMFHAIVMFWAQGLAAMQIARRTKQRKYKAVACKQIKKL